MELEPFPWALESLGAIRLEAKLLPRKLVVCPESLSFRQGLGVPRHRSHVQQISARFSVRINTRRTSRAQIWGNSRLNLFSFIWEHHGPLGTKKLGQTHQLSLNGSGACDYRSPPQNPVLSSHPCTL